MAEPAVAHVRAVLFDLDGTLLDTLEDIGRSANEALESLGFPPHPISSYREFIGDGVPMLFRRASSSGRGRRGHRAVCGRVPRVLRPRLECLQPALPGHTRVAERIAGAIAGHGRALEQTPCLYRPVCRGILAGLEVSDRSWRPRGLSSQARPRRGAGLPGSSMCVQRR